MVAPGWPILWFQPHWSAMSPACNAQKVLMGLQKPVSIGSDSCCSCSDTCITTHACSASISTMQKRKDGAASQLCLEVHQVCPALLGLVSLIRSGALQGRDRGRGRRRGWGGGGGRGLLSASRRSFSQQAADKPMLRRSCKQRISQGSGVQPLPERFADRQLALCDVIQPELVHHCITIVKSESATV